MTHKFEPTVFQKFDIKTDPKTVAPRVKALRLAMADAGLDAFLVPRADAHRGEAVPDSEARLQYLTSFTGSAGLAIVGPKKAGLFVDSRYSIQAPAETNGKVFTVIGVQHGVSPRIVEFVPKAGKVGYDPWLHTPGEVKDLEAAFAGVATLVPSSNLVDQIWIDRPAPPATPIEFLGHNRVGRDSTDKLKALRADLVKEGADVTVLTLPESICWLFNMRARDVPNTPFVLSFAIVPRAGKPTLFIDPARVTPEVKRALSGLATVAPSSSFVAELRKLGASDSRVMLDPKSVPAAVLSAVRAVSDAVIVEKRDPVLLPKSIKNEVEIGGMKEAQHFDAIAMVKFLAWFDAEAPKGKLTEIDIVTALESFRREEPTLLDISFDTISGSGANGAPNHYHTDVRTNRTLKAGEIMLVDSGGHYIGGTTDITRTMSTGKTTAEQRDRFTRVLKGMISLSMARFPKGTTGATLDILARQHLWQAGLNFAHGTGHGVGHLLGIHEGPTGFSSRSHEPIQAGMILTNEPGFYKEGAYGMRIENMMLVIPSTVGEDYLEFETITTVPIDLRLIDDRLLLPPERDWLNAYHKRVFREIGPALKGEVKAWLKEATRAI